MTVNEHYMKLVANAYRASAHLAASEAVVDEKQRELVEARNDMAVLLREANDTRTALGEYFHPTEPDF